MIGTKVTVYGAMVIEDGRITFHQDPVTVETLSDGDLSQLAEASRLDRIARARKNQEKIWSRKRLCSPTSS